MKTAITLILIIAGIALVVAYNAPQEEITAEISVLRDITQKHFAEPKAEEILPLYGLEKNKWNGGKFRCENISDVDYNQVKQASIPAAEKWLSNEFEREKEVKHFREEMEKIISDSKNDSIGKSNTSAYLPIATELNRLSKSKSERILLVFSDLMENGKNISLYGKQKMDSLKNHSEILLKYFEAQMPLEKLNGITVYLIYQPQNNSDSERFRAVSEFYRAMLESKGAKVNIGANLIL